MKPGDRVIIKGYEEFYYFVGLVARVTVSPNRATDSKTCAVLRDAMGNLVEHELHVIKYIGEE